MKSLVEKAREIFSSLSRVQDRPANLKPVRDIPLVAPARCLTPEQILAEVEGERRDPKHQAEIEYYRAKSSEYFGGQR